MRKNDFMRRGSFTVEFKRVSDAINSISCVPQPSHVSKTPSGEIETLAPNLWPIPCPKVTRVDRDNFSTSFNFRNIGLREALDPEIIIDHISRDASLSNGEINKPIKIPNDIPRNGNSRVILNFDLEPSIEDFTVTYHCICNDIDRHSYSFGDGRQNILFVSDRDGHWDIFKMNPDGTNQAHLTKGPLIWDDFPNWFPDGTRILFSRRFEDGGGICSIKPDGTQLKNLTHEKDAYPSIAPNGEKIAFWSFRKGSINSSQTYKDTEILIINSDGSDERKLIDKGAAPTWSPDGSKIAFASNRESKNPWETSIYTVNADGSGITRLTYSRSHDDFPAWSPDGSKIVFRRCPRKNPKYESSAWSLCYEQLILFDLMSGEEKCLSRRIDPIDWDPFWSPSGSLITYTSTGTPEGTMEIYVMDNEGSTRIKLTNVPGPRKFSPPGAPNGDWCPAWYRK